MIGVYEDLEGLIKFLARRFGAEGHYALDPQELEAEGRMVFARLVAKADDLSIDEFKAVFKTSLVNHLKSLLEKYRYTSKRGYVAAHDGQDQQVQSDTYVDLSDIAELIGYDAFNEVYYNEYVEAVRQIVKDVPELKLLFEVCINLPKEVEWLALAESKRKAYQKRNGQLVRNVDVVRVRQKHIAEYLGWSSTKLTNHLDTLKQVAFRVIYQ